MEIMWLKRKKEHIERDEIECDTRIAELLEGEGLTAADLSRGARRRNSTPAMSIEDVLMAARSVV